MNADNRANGRLVDQRTAVVSTSALAARLGRWTDGEGTLAHRLAQAIAHLVESGELRSGDRLPAERSLAAAVTVSRGTVVAAYGMLGDDGIVERRQGSGTRIAGAVRAPAESSRPTRGEALYVALPSAIDLLRAVPRMPRLAEQVVRQHVPAPDAATLGDTDPAGMPELRARIARLMSDDGTPTTPEQILVTHGAQGALSLVVDELVAPGDTVLTESATWPGVADWAQRRGAHVQGIEMGDGGIDVDALETAIVMLRPALIAVNPHHHNPTGTRMPPAARLRVAELAARYGVPVLEDRVLAHVSFDGVVPPTLAALRQDAPVIVVDSLSKWAWPGLRVGWVRADPVLVRRLRGLRLLVDQSTSVPAQLLALDLIEHAAALRTEVSREHAAAAEVLADAMAVHLPEWRYTPPRGGLWIWAELPAGSSTAFARVAARHGVAVAGGVEFAASVSPDDHIRVPFTAPGPELREGVRRLGAAWREYRASL